MDKYNLTNRRLLRIEILPSSVIVFACFANSLRRSSVKGGIFEIHKEHVF